jgi:flagellar motility protein MotE (MotC chaperone)
MRQQNRQLTKDQLITQHLGLQQAIGERLAQIANAKEELRGLEAKIRQLSTDSTTQPTSRRLARSYSRSESDSD